MAILCPNCQHSISLVGIRPGKFKPTCPNCKERFVLMVPEDSGQAPQVARIERAITKPAYASAREKREAEIAEVLGLEAPKTRKSKPRAVPQAISTSVAKGGPVSGPTALNATALPSDNQAPVIEEPKPETPPETTEELHGRLGGYEVQRKLGQGGMGTVYLARQMSLDRDVALKVMNPSWAADPVFVARFTREAFAAAQLTHHHVVQIHDIGEDKKLQFFSMEFVEGDTLAGLLKDQGRLDPETAVGYVLQAARGLKFAHDHGMVHRDVKPENLLVNDQGIVKVADLGLVKTPTSKDGRSNLKPDESQATGVTQINVSMGTPLYMAPEQATDAANVDARADIYSLGSTLYALLVGRPPFIGNSAIEVITKHRLEPMVPPEQINRRVPESLSRIIQKMTAKEPSARYQNMGEVIKELEGFLGVQSGKPFAPGEEHVDDLEREAGAFNDSKWAGLRRKLIIAFCAVVALALAAMFATNRPLLGGGLVGFAVITTIAYIVTQGVMQKTILWSKIRQLVFGARLIDWLMWIVALAMLVGILFVLDQLWVWLGFGLLAIGVAVGFYFSLDLLTARQRSFPIRAVGEMLKGFRIKGLDEDAIRGFVAKFSGNNWEEFYEALFGYEDKLIARQRYGKGEGGKDRPRFSPWRDRVIAWIDHKITLRQERRQQRYLQKIESRKLSAEGVSAVDAKKKARQVAEKLVHRAAVMRDESSRRLAATVGPTMAPGRLDVLNAVQVVRPLYDDAGHEAGADDPGERKRESYLQRKYGGPLGLLVGPQVRFALGAVLLAGFIGWLYQNKTVPLPDAGLRAVQEFGATHDKLSAEDKYFHQATKVTQVQVAKPTKDLSIPMVPAFITVLFSNYNTGIAGVLLVISCLFPGTKLGWFVIPGAGLIFAGHLIPNLPEFPVLARFVPPTIRSTPLAGGGLLALLGLLFARK